MSNAPTIKLDVFGRTDVGQIREHNEDNFVLADLTRRARTASEADRHQSVGQRGLVMGVCDGMGGAAAGEVASQLAVDIIFEKLTDGEPPASADELARRLVKAVEEAGSRIHAAAWADRSRRGMGTTSTISTLLDRRLFVAQVGDSRAYILRNGVLKQVSRDQSLVTQLIEAGQLTEEEAENFEHNNIILQALGTAATVQVDLTYVDLCQGDVLMLCSDGLSGMIRNDAIRSILMSKPDPVEAAHQLIASANEAGGHDNVTVIVARFEEGLPPLTPEEPEVAYRKYVLTEERAATPTSLRAKAPPKPGHKPAAEGSTSSRRLKVGVTMVGGAGGIEGFDPSKLPPPPSRPPAPKPTPWEDEPPANLQGGLNTPLLVAAVLFLAAVGYFVFGR